MKEQVKILSDRAVAYLNVDLAIEGNVTMRAKATPLLYSLLYKVAGSVSFTYEHRAPDYVNYLIRYKI